MCCCCGCKKNEVTQVRYLSPNQIKPNYDYESNNTLSISHYCITNVQHLLYYQHLVMGERAGFCISLTTLTNYLQIYPFIAHF